MFVHLCILSFASTLAYASPSDFTSMEMTQEWKHPHTAISVATEPLTLHECSCSYNIGGEDGRYHGCQPGSEVRKIGGIDLGFSGLCCHGDDSMYVRTGPDCSVLPMAKSRAQQLTDDPILGAINEVINERVVPILQAAIGGLPNPLNVNVAADGRTRNVCIIPSPWGCICRARASYSANIREVFGLPSIRIGSLDITDTNLDTNTLTGSLDFLGQAGAPSLGVTGRVGSRVSACGISVTPGGPANGVLRGSAAVEATGSISPCTNGQRGFKLSLFQFKFFFRNARVQNIDINLTGSGIINALLDLAIDGIVALIQAFAPGLATQIANSASDQLAGAVEDQIANVLPQCIPV